VDRGRKPDSKRGKQKGKACDWRKTSVGKKRQPKLTRGAKGGRSRGRSGFGFRTGGKEGTKQKKRIQRPWGDEENTPFRRTRHLVRDGKKRDAVERSIKKGSERGGGAGRW